MGILDRTGGSQPASVPDLMAMVDIKSCLVVEHFNLSLMMPD